MACVYELVVSRLDNLPVYLVCPACVVTDCPDRQLEIHLLSSMECLAVIEGLNRGQFVEVLRHEVGKVVEVLPAFRTGNLETP